MTRIPRSVRPKDHKLRLNGPWFLPSELGQQPVAEALAEPDLDATIRRLVGLLLAHAGGRLADDVLLVLSEPVGVRDVLSSPL
jgi:hypothetical protein